LVSFSKRISGAYGPASRGCRRQHTPRLFSQPVQEAAPRCKRIDAAPQIALSRHKEPIPRQESALLNSKENLDDLKTSRVHPLIGIDRWRFSTFSAINDHPLNGKNTAYRLVQCHGERGSKRVLYKVSQNYDGMLTEQNRLLEGLAEVLQNGAGAVTSAMTRNRLAEMASFYLTMRTSMDTVLQKWRASRPLSR
jgi:hypothetical protein